MSIIIFIFHAQKVIDFSTKNAYTSPMSYAIVFSNKRYNLGLKIKNGEVIVVAPSAYNCDNGKRIISNFVTSKYSWIDKKLKIFSENILNLPNILNMTAFFWHGKQIYPQFSHSIKKIKFDGETLIFPYFSDLGIFKQQLKNVFKKQAKTELCQRLNFYAERYNFHFENYAIIDTATKWGACNSKQKISLNWRLAIINSDLMDYVILHELCHLLHMNHSSKFWSELYTYEPNYKQLRKSLNEYSFLMAYLDKNNN